MKALLIIASAMMLFTTSILAQSNTVKLGIPGLFTRKINLNYERNLINNQNINVGFGFLAPGSLYTRVDETFQDSYKEELQGLEPLLVNGQATVQDIESNLSGWSFRPEYRFYTKKGSEMKGFYFAPFLLINRYKTESVITANANVTVTDQNTQASTTEEYAVTGLFNNTISTLGGGLQLGVQFRINFFVIDLYFAGLGVNSYKGESTFSVPNLPEEVNIDFQGMEQELNTNLGEIPLVNTDNFTTSSDNESITAGGNILLPSFRCGFSLGVAF